MTARSFLRSVAPLTLSAVASVLLAAGCSAPPGADTGDDGVPEFGGLPSGTPGVGAGGTASAGTGNPPTASAGTTGTGAPPVAAGTGGSTGAPSNEQPGGNNVGLDPNQNDGQNGGQNQGAGGSMMVGAAGNGNVGSAGAPTNPPVQGTAGQTSMPPGDNNQQPQNPPEQPQNPPAQNPEQPQTPPQAANCGNAFLCDDFEGVAAGASPSSVWQIVQNFGFVDQSAAVVVSGENSRSGGQALRVTGSDGRTGVVASIPQSTYFVRAFLQIDTIARGTVFIGLGVDQQSENRFRVQGDNFATINTNDGGGEEVSPGNANGGACPECVTLTANEWICAEMAIDNAARTATLFIDGAEAAVAGPDVFVNQPATPAFFLGSWGLQGGVSSVWIDDVAAGPQRIGCN